MQFTIVSDKLPTLSEEQFAYEFRVVHARETRTMAINLGIIQKYVQGLALPTVVTAHQSALGGGAAISVLCTVDLAIA